MKCFFERAPELLGCHLQKTSRGGIFSVHYANWRHGNIAVASWIKAWNVLVVQRRRISQRVLNHWGSLEWEIVTQIRPFLIPIRQSFFVQMRLLRRYNHCEIISIMKLIKRQQKISSRVQRTLAEIMIKDFSIERQKAFQRILFST